MYRQIVSIMSTIKFIKTESTGLFINHNTGGSEWGWARVESSTITRKLGVRFENKRHAFYRGTVEGLEADLKEFGNTGIPGRIIIQDFTIDSLDENALAQLNLKSDKNPNGLELEEALKRFTKKFYDKSMTAEQAEAAPALTINGKTIYRFNFCDFDFELQDVTIIHDNVEAIERYKATIGLSVAAKPAAKRVAAL